MRLGVANQQIVVRVIELPRIEDEKQRDAAVRFQAAEAIAMPLDEAVLDHQVAGYTEAPDGTPRMQVVVVAARRSMIEALLEAAKGAGLKPEGIDLDAFALVRTLAAASQTTPDDGARGLLPPRRRHQPRDRGRHDLLLHPPALRRLGRRPTPARALADEIRLSIDYYMTQPQAQAGRRGRRCPAPARATRRSSRASASTSDCPTAVAAPLGAAGRAALAGGEDPHRYTVAAGLALGAAA